MSQTAVDATKLIPLIEKAYGKDTVADSFDFGAINDQFNKEKAEKKAEVKSMTEIGADLDAARYSQIEGGLNDLMEQAKNGSIVVGSPEWVAKVSQWKTGAGHLKQAADLDAGITKMAYENPDTFQYITQDENGVIVNTGLKGYKRDLTALNNQEFADPQARVEAEAKIGQRVSVADRSVEDAYKRLQNEANDLNKELNKSANEVSKRVKVTLGSEVFEITSQIDEEHTQQVVDMFVNQFAEDLGGEYAKLAAQGRIPKDEKGKDLTPTEYINRQVKAFITRGEKKTTIMRRPADKTSNNNSNLNRSGNGWSFGNYYGSVLTEKASDPKFGSEEQEYVTGITIENRKTNPQQDFVDEDGEAVRGSLVRITKEGDEIILHVRSGKNTEPLPLSENFDILRTEYGLSEQEIEKLFKRESNTTSKGERVINNGVGSKYN